MLCRTFVGRVAELDHLVARRRAAAAGRGGAVLIAGEAGVGKSRLLAEFRGTLQRRTTRVAWGACREFAQRPLGPWLDVLNALDPDAAAAFTTRTFATKNEQTTALIETFERLAARSTTLIFLEDLHWGDPSIAHVLLALTERAAEQRILFVGTYRDDEIRAGHAVFPVLGRLLRERATSLVRLTPFDDREMTQLLRAALPARTELPRSMLGDVRRRADGNALFGEELLRHAVDRSRYGEERVTEPLPLSLDAIIRERLARCERDDRELLMRASLFGGTFDIDVLAEIADSSVEDCRSALERLAAHQLIDPAGTDTARFAFRHALTRDVIYGEIPAESLPALHRRVADAIVQRGAAEQHVEALAHNYWLASDCERAAPYCVAAGDAARSLHAYEDAASWYERAAATFAEPVDSARALVNAGLMHVHFGDPDGALALYGRAGDTYECAGRIDEAIVPRVMAAGPLHNGGRAAEAIALLQATKERLGGRASREFRDRLVVRLGFLYAFARRTDEAWTAAQEIGDETLLAETALAAEANFLHAALHAQRAEPELWRHHLERGLTIFERIGALPDNVRAALGNGGMQALALGETALARDYQARAAGLARALNSEVELESLGLAEIELREGRLEAARTLLHANAAPTAFNARVKRALIAADLAALRGDDAGVAVPDLDLLAEAERGGHDAATIKLSTSYALALRAAGRDAEASRLLERASELIGSAYDATLPLATLARLRPDLAATHEALVARAGARPADEPGRALHAFVRAAIAAARADASVAETAGAEGARRFAALGWPVLEAWARELAGDLSGARAAFRALGAHAEVRRLERAPATPGTPRSQTSLTPRERELARIVAEGKSNRAAAAALSVSEKAVEKHLTSIYAKLGMTSRAQLAAYVASHRNE